MSSVSRGLSLHICTCVLLVSTQNFASDNFVSVSSIWQRIQHCVDTLSESDVIQPKSISSHAKLVELCRQIYTSYQGLYQSIHLFFSTMPPWPSFPHLPYPKLSNWQMDASYRPIPRLAPISPRRVRWNYPCQVCPCLSPPRKCTPVQIDTWI